MSGSFDDLSAAYDAMVDWPKRLANEEPLYRWLIQRIGVHRVLDAACGTGHHAALFRSWGLIVEGADISSRMIDLARDAYGEDDGLRWIVRPFTQSADRPQPFDLAICVGNSLALAGDLLAAAAGVAAMLSSVRRGGAILIHVFNLWRLPDGECVWQKCLRATLPQGQSLIIKGIHRAGRRGYVDMLVTALDAEPPALHSDCVPFLGLQREDLEPMARAAGAAQVEFYGSYQRDPYDRQASQDLIMLAIRG